MHVTLHADLQAVSEEIQATQKWIVLMYLVSSKPHLSEAERTVLLHRLFSLLFLLIWMSSVCRVLFLEDPEVIITLLPLKLLDNGDLYESYFVLDVQRADYEVQTHIWGSVQCSQINVWNSYYSLNSQKWNWTLNYFKTNTRSYTFDLA